MEQKKLKKQITYGVILIIIGISIFVKDFVADKREEVFSAMNLEISDLLASTEESEEVVEPVDPPVVNDVPVEEVVVQTPPPAPKEEVKKEYETYAGILEIPAIGFSKGFYKKESKLNNVKFNLKILPQSNYPNEDKGNVIIIGHSGNYNNSYFRDLYKLVIDDIAIIKYNNINYTYKVVNIYTDNKDGTVTVYRNENKNCLTLITCTKDDSTKQTIYILELVSAE